jgi:hypothetical protein
VNFSGSLVILVNFMGFSEFTDEHIDLNLTIDVRRRMYAIFIDLYWNFIGFWSMNVTHFLVVKSKNVFVKHLEYYDRMMPNSLL